MTSEYIVMAAHTYAYGVHKGQYRKVDNLFGEREEYIEHPKRVAQNVRKYKDSRHMDILVAAALLHDTVEDANVTVADIRTHFGDTVAGLVEELTSYLPATAPKNEYLAEKMVEMTSWALVIKLSDRLDNVSDLRRTDEGFRTKYIKETRYILSYLIANRPKLTGPQIDLIHAILKEINGLEKM